MTIIARLRSPLMAAIFILFVMGWAWPSAAPAQQAAADLTWEGLSQTGRSTGEIRSDGLGRANSEARSDVSWDGLNSSYVGAPDEAPGLYHGPLQGPGSAAKTEVHPATANPAESPD